MATVSPQKVVGATPQRISTTTIKARSVIIEYAQDNTGKIFVADTEANASTLNRHTLDSANQHITIEPDDFANLEGWIDLRDIWLHGDTTGDRFVITYIDVTECLK